MGPARKWSGVASNDPLMHDDAKLLFDISSEDGLTHSEAQWSKVAALLNEHDAREMSENPEKVLPTRDSFFHAAKNRHDPDTPNYVEAMSGDDADLHFDAMKQEAASLVKRKTWTVTPKPKG